MENPVNKTDADVEILVGKLINLTPHNVSIINTENEVKVIEPSGIMARVRNSTTKHYSIEGVSVYEQSGAIIDDLPSPKPGIYFIVSAIVKQTNLFCEGTLRDDLLIPNNMIKDADGITIGCRSLLR